MPRVCLSQMTLKNVATAAFGADVAAAAFSRGASVAATAMNPLTQLGGPVDFKQAKFCIFPCRYIEHIYDQK